MYPNELQNMEMMLMQTNRLGITAMMARLNVGGSINNNTLVFVGNSISLETRLDSYTNQEVSSLVDANITVNGTEIQTFNKCSYFCTFIWGSILIFPFFLFCMNCWKKCTYPAFNIAPSVYRSLSKILLAQNLRNLTLTIADNTFNVEKANILYQLISRSRLKGFTLINTAGEYDFNERENSDFIEYMKSFKSLPNLETDLRWGTQIVF